MASLTYRICFVCSGNICRSPIAESVVRHELREAGLDGQVDVSSAGTGDWHEGAREDRRASAALRRRGYALDHRARQFDPSWFADHDLIVALDIGHLRWLRRLAPDAAAAERVRLLRSFDPSAGAEFEVPDPYYGSDAEFDHVVDLVEAAAPGIVAEVRRQLSARNREAR